MTVGSRGPQPTPTRIKEITGNPGKRALNKGEVKPRGQLRKPSIIKDAAAEKWDELIAAMPPGFFTPADSEALATYCIAWVFYSKAVVTLATEGLIAKGSQDQPVAHPMVSIKRAQEEVLQKMGDRLGLSPASRTKLTAEGDQEEDDPEARFFGRPH